MITNIPASFPFFLDIRVSFILPLPVFSQVPFIERDDEMDSTSHRRCLTWFPCSFSFFGSNET